jgi:hypothetical protein
MSTSSNIRPAKRKHSSLLVRVVREEETKKFFLMFRPHGLPDVHELGDGVFVLQTVLGVVLQDEVLEGLAKVDLFRLLQAQGDHWYFRIPENRKLK